jgi:hypothetical protein
MEPYTSRIKAFCVFSEKEEEMEITNYRSKSNL